MRREPPDWSNLVVAPLLVLLLTWPMPLRPTWLLAHPLGEGTNHHWMFWRALQDLPVANWPAGIDIPLMDPINLPFALGGLVHPALAYNGVVLAGLLLAYAGAWVFARELEAGPWGSMIAGIAAASAPALGAAADFGISEALPVGWLGFHAACLLALARPGSTRRALLLALGAGLTLAAFVLAGWYHALFGLIVEVGLVIWTLVRARALRTLKPGLLGLAGAQGLLALALILPRLLAFLEIRELWSYRWVKHSPFPPEFRPAWRSLPAFGTDLLNLVLPSLDTVEVSKCVYVGLVGLALALCARKRAPLLLAAPLYLLSLGHWLSVGGQTRHFERIITLPGAWLVDWFPALVGLSHWQRAAVPASFLVAVAVGLGAARLIERFPWAAWGLPVLLVADALALSQTPWPRPMTPTKPPKIYASLQGEGALIELPFDNHRKQFTTEQPRRSNLWQPFHGKPVAENHEGDDELIRTNRWVRTVDENCRRATPVATLSIPEGVDSVLLQGEWCARAEQVTELLTEQLGPPAVVVREDRLWFVLGPEISNP